MRSLSPSQRRAVLIAVFAAASLGLLAFSLYIIALDQEIRGRFAGARWALPAQVYAAPMELYPGLPLTQGTFQRELERLGYRNTRRVEGPGTYAATKGHVSMYSRFFQFWDGAQPARRLELAFTDAQVADVVDAERGEHLNLARLDPLLIGSIYPTQGEDRVLVKLDEVPPLLKQGLIEVEDRSFAHHFGIDLKAILRAAFANLRAGHAVQGGSTITQQLVKNFFLNSERTWTRKFNELFMALLLEAHYSKDEILEAYINEVHLGQDGGRAVHGFGLASQFYYNKPLTELQPQEIAMLIGLVKGPSFYNPRKHPERARERRNLILGIFADTGLLQPGPAALAQKKSLGLAGGATGSATRYPAFVDLVKRQLTGQYAETDLTNEGLRIFTTLDPATQDALEKRLLEGLPRLEKSFKLKPGVLEGAGVVTRVEGGEVLAVVGGRDVRYPGFNRALDARRPIGSLAKPFVYLAALMQPERYNLSTTLDDDPIEVLDPHAPPWSPKNYDDELHGKIPLFQALAHSYNLATVRLGMDIGVNNVRPIFRAAGMLDDPPALPSIFLGAIDLSPVEIAQMYGTLAASGYQSPLLAIREVMTKDGQPLARYPLRVRQVLPEGPVYLLNWALQQVMLVGTGTSAYNYVPARVRLAGKTGTTDDLRDSWFAGYGSDRVAVIWVGRDDNETANLSGATGALQIWAPLVRDLGIKSFEPPQPPDIEVVPTDPASGMRADEKCASAVEIPYMQGHAPTAYAPCAGWKSRFSW